MRNNLLGFLLLVVGLLSYPVHSFATVEFHPRLMVEEEFNDNIFLSDGNEVDDWITTVAPGISLNYTNRSVEASLDYSLYYQFYQEDADRNQDNFEDVQRADANVLFFAGRPFTLRLTEAITREVIDESDRNAEYNELVNHSTVYHTTAVPEYSLQLMPTLSLVMGFTYDRFDYVDSRGNDSEEHEGRISLIKQLTSSTEIFGRGAYAIHQSDADGDDFKRQDFTLGFTQQIGGRTTISAEGGYSKVDFRHDGNFDTDTVNWLVDTSYQLSEPLVFNIGYSQDFTTTTEDGLTKLREASVGASYTRESLTASTTIFWNNSDYVRLDREDKAYGVRIDFSKSLSQVLTANIDAEYEQAKYSVLSEDVDRFTAGVSIDYAYRRFVASLGYRYRINESNVSDNDYDNNILTLSGTVRF